MIGNYTSHGPMANESESVLLSLDELCKLDPLTKEGEFACADAWHNDGDLDAIDRLVMHNIKFAVKMCNDYAQNGITVDDLLGEAILGMYHAAKKYRSGGVKFISYAVWWIRSYLQSYTLLKSRTIHSPVQSKYGMTYIRRFRSLVGSNAYADPDTIREKLGLTGNEFGATNAALKSAQFGMTSIRSLNDTMGEGENSCEYIDMVQSSDPTPEEIAEGASRMDAILFSLSCLDERERDIITRLYLDEDYFTPKMMTTGRGDSSKTYMSLDEVGKLWGISRERVRQIKNGAFEKMQMEHGDLLRSLL